MGIPATNRHTHTLIHEQATQLADDFNSSAAALCLFRLQKPPCLTYKPTHTLTERWVYSRSNCQHSDPTYRYTVEQYRHNTYRKIHITYTRNVHVLHAHTNGDFHYGNLELLVRLCRDDQCQDTRLATTTTKLTTWYTRDKHDVGVEG